jgi:hypothetical protein
VVAVLLLLLFLVSQRPDFSLPSSLFRAAKISVLSPAPLITSIKMSSTKHQSKSQLNSSPSDELAEDLMAMKRLQLRRILRGLDEIKGSGTSLISLMISPNGSLQRVLTKLHDEYALSDQIQSRV